MTNLGDKLDPADPKEACNDWSTDPTNPANQLPKVDPVSMPVCINFRKRDVEHMMRENVTWDRVGMVTIDDIVFIRR